MYSLEDASNDENNNNLYLETFYQTMGFKNMIQQVMLDCHIPKLNTYTGLGQTALREASLLVRNITVCKINKLKSKFDVYLTMIPNEPRLPG